MNHQADIEEGFEVFDDERERQDAERLFQRYPSRITFKAEDRSFTAATVRTIHLLGSSRALGKPVHLFDFEEGYVAAEGTFTGSPVAVSVEARWSDYGKVLHLSV